MQNMNSIKSMSNKIFNNRLTKCYMDVYYGKFLLKKSNTVFRPLQIFRADASISAVCTAVTIF